MSDKEEISEMEISGSLQDFERMRGRHSWISFDFRSERPRVLWFIVAQDNDGKSRDWIAGSYEEMKGILKSIEHSPEIKKFLGRAYPQVIFDYRGGVLADIKERIRLRQRKFKKWYKTYSYWGKAFLGLVITIIGAFIIYRLGWN